MTELEKAQTDYALLSDDYKQLSITLDAQRETIRELVKALRIGVQGWSNLNMWCQDGGYISSPRYTEPVAVMKAVLAKAEKAGTR